MPQLNWYFYIKCIKHTSVSNHRFSLNAELKALKLVRIYRMIRVCVDHMNIEVSFTIRGQKYFNIALVLQDE